MSLEPFSRLISLEWFDDLELGVGMVTLFSPPVVVLCVVHFY